MNSGHRESRAPPLADALPVSGRGAADARLRHEAAAAALRWMAAAFAALLAHAAIVWIAHHWKPAREGTGEPPPAIAIEIASPLAAEAPPQDVAPGPEMEEAQPEAAPDVPETPETPDDTPSADAALPAPADESPVPVSDAPSDIAKPAETRKAEPIVEAPPKPKPVRKRPNVRKAERKPPVNRHKPRANRTSAPAATPAVSAARSAAPSSVSSLASMSPASWRGALMAHLNRHKRYPSGAADAGTATVAFTINRAGVVTAARLVRSSGDSALDAAAIALPRRASPVPEPPAQFAGAAITVAVPIRFSR